MVHDPQPQAFAPVAVSGNADAVIRDTQPGDAAVGFHFDPYRVGLRVLHGVGDRLLRDAVQVRDDATLELDGRRSPSTWTRSL